MIRKKEIIIIITAFLLGVGLMYSYRSNELNHTRIVANKVLDNCTKSLTAANTIINSCNEAYKEFGACVMQGQSCDLEQSMAKLKLLNEQKQSAEDKIKVSTVDLMTINDDIKDLRSQ